MRYSQVFRCIEEPSIGLPLVSQINRTYRLSAFRLCQVQQFVTCLGTIHIKQFLRIRNILVINEGILIQAHNTSGMRNRINIILPIRLLRQ